MNFRYPMRVVAPTLDGDVLAVLARVDAEMTGRELQRQAGHGSHQGIKNAADRLTREGIVERRSVGNSHLYRLNRRHIAAPWIERLATLFDQVIDHLQEAIADWPQPPLVAMLFGSVARGTATPHSDMDVLIVRPAGCDPDEPRWSRQVGDLQAAATAWTGHDTRIVEYGEEELAVAGRDSLLGDILRDGIELYGSRHTLRRAIPGRAR